MAQKPLILIVDADAATHRSLAAALEIDGRRVASAMSLPEGVAAMVMRPPDAVLLELAGADEIRLADLGAAIQAYDGPILAMAAVGEPSMKAAIIDAGAYDVIAKPLVIGDLVAQLRAALAARVSPARPVRIQAGGLVLDLARRQVHQDGAAIRLPAREYDLLALLVLSRGRVLTHGQLVQSLWSEPHADSVQHLRVLVGNLRQRIEPDPASPVLILTLPAVGYQFTAPATALDATSQDAGATLEARSP